MVEVSTERFRLLTELCLTAISEGRLGQAEPMAEALAAARPEDEATFVVRILLDVCRQNHEVAMQTAEKAVGHYPDSQRLGAFRALALMAGGYTSRAEAALEPIAADASDPAAASLAKALLQQETRENPDRKDVS